MDYTKSATLMQMKFMAEWNNLLGVFNRILFAIPNTDNLRVFILLINKINSNCRAAINLIDQGFINEGLILFRSAIETTIYAKYLKLYPEKQSEFLQFSDIFLVKNQFVQYKKIRNDKFSKPYELPILQQSIENNIRELFKVSTFLQKELSAFTFTFNDQDIQLLDKFLRKQKFPSQKVSDLLKQIEVKEPNFAKTHLRFHDIFYPYYDENSAILHGNSRYWNEQPILDDFTLHRISSHLIRVLVITTDLVQQEIPRNACEALNQAVHKLTDLEFKSFPTPFLASQNPHSPQQYS